MYCVEVKYVAIRNDGSVKEYILYDPTIEECSDMSNILETAMELGKVVSWYIEY